MLASASEDKTVALLDFKTEDNDDEFWELLVELLPSYLAYLVSIWQQNY